MKTVSPKVSIIIPAYNQGRFLEAAIRSAIEQSHDALEVLVIDDGSTDETPDVIARFAADPRVRGIRQENRGLAGARNRGIEEATGDYLCFLDADDRYHPEKIRKQVEILEQDASLGLAYCDIVTVDERDNVVDDGYSVGAARSRLSGDIFESLILGGYFPPLTAMVRRDALCKVGPFEPELGGHADYEMWLRLSAEGFPAYYLDEKLAFYRSHDANMSKDAEHMDATLLQTLNKTLERYPNRVAEAIPALQALNRDLFSANRWLRESYGEILNRAGEYVPGGEDDAGQYRFLEHLRQGELLEGSADQVAAWDVEIDGGQSRGMLLQPPAGIRFRLPNPAAGQLLGAVAIHPEAWDKTGGGACQFTVTVDGRSAFTTVLDPHHNASDRGWFEFKLGVPQRDGGHEVVFKTDPLGGPIDFRWAVWREPVMVWQG